MSKRADNGKGLLKFLYDQCTFVKNIVEVWITKVDKTASLKDGLQSADREEKELYIGRSQ